jgi:hypothetical protein
MSTASTVATIGSSSAMVVAVVLRSVRIPMPNSRYATNIGPTAR